MFSIRSSFERKYIRQYCLRTNGVIGLFRQKFMLDLLVWRHNTFQQKCSTNKFIKLFKSHIDIVHYYHAENNLIIAHCLMCNNKITCGIRLGVSRVLLKQISSYELLRSSSSSTSPTFLE